MPEAPTALKQATAGSQMVNSLYFHATHGAHAAHAAHAEHGTYEGRSSPSMKLARDESKTRGSHDRRIEKSVANLQPRDVEQRLRDEGRMTTTMARSATGVSDVSTRDEIWGLGLGRILRSRESRKSRKSQS